MVLGRVLLIAVVTTGCSQSLFDSHGTTGSGSSGDDAAVPATCQAPCVGDAAADFDGTAAGTTGNWRYLDDHRDRTWTAMTPAADAMTGADPANAITTCTAQPDAPVCQLLPGALLVSSSGSTSPADPAVELTVATAQVVQVSVLARVPDGEPPQQIRLYRNSREDVLFTGIAAPGSTLENAITLDALAGDRFLVA
ncbi:MAG TPA: hypothetical protein VGO00_06820, partial [Kofleriaceae bacterium]|nr:hypothetical protein [Kofleriaceae bacterium]